MPTTVSIPINGSRIGATAANASGGTDIASTSPPSDSESILHSDHSGAAFEHHTSESGSGTTRNAASTSDLATGMREHSNTPSTNADTGNSENLFHVEETTSDKGSVFNESKNHTDLNHKHGSTAHHYCSELHGRQTQLASHIMHGFCACTRRDRGDLIY